jgi:hypothetical protein
MVLNGRIADEFITKNKTVQSGTAIHQERNEQARNQEERIAKFSFIDLYEMETVLEEII